MIMLLLATINEQVKMVNALGIYDLTLYIRRGDFVAIRRFFEHANMRGEIIAPDAELTLFGCEIQFINDEADGHEYRAIIGQRSTTWSVGIDQEYHVVAMERGI